jgi:aspartate aminotransferase
MATLEHLPPRAVVLLHASCHNPTGADLSQDEWRAVLELVKRRSLLPFIDMAYQGLGEGPDADAFAIRLFSAELPELVCAVSCSKNFGLYRERTGALHIINDSPASGDATLSQLVRLARGMWSMPPDHGAEIVRRILSNPSLREAWAKELEGMRQRITGLRHELVRQLRAHCPERDFSFIATQRGMFSFFGITPEQVKKMRTEHHIYMTDDSRINIAGLRAQNLEYVAQATAQVLAA